MSFDATLARKILQWIQDGLEGRHLLPHDDQADLGRLLTEEAVTIADYKYTLSVLRKLEIIQTIPNKVVQDKFSLTEKGLEVISNGGTLRETLARIVADQPGGTIGLNEVKGMSPYKELSGQEWRKLQDAVIDAEYVERTSVGRTVQNLTIKQGSPYREDSGFLIEIRDQGYLSTQGRNQKSFLASQYVSRLPSVPSTKINPGKCFELQVSFEGVELLEHEKVTFKYEGPPQDIQYDFYSKLYLLTLVMKGSPFSTRGDNNLFLNKGQVQRTLSPFWGYRAAIDQPLASALALFFVRLATTDVAAAAITYPAAGQVHLYITKNSVVEEDLDHAMNLLGLLSGDLRRRYGNLSAFTRHAFLHVLRPHCRKKIEKRLCDIDAETFKDFLVHLGHASCSIFMVHKKDKTVDGLMKKINKASRLEVIKEMLTTVIRYRGMVKIDDDDATDLVMLYSYILFNSRNFQSEFESWRTKTNTLGPALDNLRKVAAYYQGLVGLWRALTSGCRVTKTVTKPFTLQVTVIPSPPPLRVNLVTDWYKLLQDFYKGDRGGNEPLDILKETFLDVWLPKDSFSKKSSSEDSSSKPHSLKDASTNRASSADDATDDNPSVPESRDLHIPETLDFLYHCGLSLSDFLRWNGIKRAVIGVSKDSCEMCSVALAKRNDLQEGWLLADGHHQVYQCLLPNFYNTAHAPATVVTKSMVYAVEQYLRREIASVKGINQSPVYPIFDPSSDLEDIITGLDTI